MRWFRRRDPDWEAWDREHLWDVLAIYNSERARGLVHTPEYDAAMAEEQRRFNEQQAPP